MEYLIEFVIELLFEGSIAASKSDKVPKAIRVLLIFIISIFFLMIIGLFFLVGFMTLNKNVFVGIFFLILGLLFLFMSIYKFKKIYLVKKK